MIKFAICDDEIETINLLENCLKKINNNILCDRFFNGEQLISEYNKEKYDVIFLDIEMDKLNGIKTADIIRKNNENVIIIFVTSHSEYMKESFKCEPFRFVEKPFEFEEIKEIYKDITVKLSKKRTVFAFSENKAKIRLYCDDIIYCESQSHYILIYTKERTYKVFMSMKDICEKLEKDILCRVHKSFIINFNYVKYIDKDEIYLYNIKNTIPLGRLYKKDVLSMYTDFIERKFIV